MQWKWYIREHFILVQSDIPNSLLPYSLSRTEGIEALFPNKVPANMWMIGNHQHWSHVLNFNASVTCLVNLSKFHKICFGFLLLKSSKKHFFTHYVYWGSWVMLQQLVIHFNWLSCYHVYQAFAIACHFWIKFKDNLIDVQLYCSGYSFSNQWQLLFAEVPGRCDCHLLFRLRSTVPSYEQ